MLYKSRNKHQNCIYLHYLTLPIVLEFVLLYLLIFNIYRCFNHFSEEKNINYTKLQDLPLSVIS